MPFVRSEKAFSNQEMPVTAAVADSLWIRRPAPNPQARLRLFCFPYAGSTASAFRNWPDHLPACVEVCPLQLPGRENRLDEVPFTSLEPMVRTLANVLSPFMDRPFAFYGHSMGTLIAFELARELRRLRRPLPVQLFVSGRCAPHISDPDKRLHKLSDAEFIEGLRRYNGTPEAVLNNAALMEFMLPLLRADFTACETYTCKGEQPLDIPISAFAGTEEYCRDMLGAWGDQTSAHFEEELVTGGHFFLHSERARFVGIISRKLLEKIGS